MTDRTPENPDLSEDPVELDGADIADIEDESESEGDRAQVRPVVMTPMTPLPQAGGLNRALQPGFLDEFWPVRTPAAPRRALLVTVLAAVFAASVIGLDRPGIGWFIGGVGMSSALIALANGAKGRLRLPWLLAALALMAVGAVRAADWLFVLCVLTACVTASLAVAGGKSVRALAFGAAAVSVAALRAVPWAGAGLRALGRAGESTPRILRSVFIALVLLVVFGTLLGSADEAFAGLLDGLTPDLDADGLAEWVYLFGLVALATLGAAFLLANPPRIDAMPQVSTRRRVKLVEWTLPVATLVVLFGAFVAVQLTVLFGGSEYVLNTANLTYANYARSGFWQLLAVTLLTLVVLGVAARVAPTDTASQRLWLRVLLGALAGLSLVIVISALFRMWTYQETYGFTVLRLLVGFCEIWLGLVYVLVLVAGVRPRADWVPRAVLATAIALLIGLAALNPDRFIAERNLARYAETGKIDEYYLSRLSADAVPALVKLPEPMRSCALAGHVADLSVHRDRPLDWNLGRAQARAALAGIAPVVCDSGRYR
ncbi:DUF4153 domain-containing protein [Actinokineospora xionganensis]|uniref:DUF4173 domain-containing protein n=1 Tax=Actinokineospora xionganensis TaxID=2684470 RepID=A0ABR7LGD4_9PSEU|nr:DUF4173 domain-containing protein [Actinokineospora xionganensis]MBC6451668.1 DUF4173 domain-containing protein [Actinokineospora xionganensis]